MEVMYITLSEFDNPIDAKNHLNNIKLLNFKNSYIVTKEEPNADQ